MQYNAKYEILIWAVLSSSTVNFGLEIMFSMIIFIVLAIENQKNPKNKRWSIFDFQLILADFITL